MAKRELREQALEMRKKGMSYSQIKASLSVSKAALSIWLREYPLSRERVNELRGRSEKRIERYRETRARNRTLREEAALQSVSASIGTLTARELHLAGLFLYWAEGTKASRGTLCLTNTDPSMVRFFMRWLLEFGVPKERMRVRLHLYSDMDIHKETLYWMNILDLGKGAFRSPYIKASSYEKPRNYKGRFGHGTCNLLVTDIAAYEKVMASIKHLQENLGAIAT